MKNRFQWLVGLPKSLFLRFMKFSWKKKIAVVIVLIVVFFIGSAIYTNATKKPSYTTARVGRSNIVEVVSETGSIIASGRTDVYSPTNGVVSKVLVKNGDSVKENQELFSVESSATEREQQAAYATYLTAANTLALEKAEIHSLQSVLFQENQAFMNDRGVDNPSKDQRDDPVYIEQNAEWLKAEADYKNQEKVISQAQANASATWLLYQATQNAAVKAPVAGTVANLAVTTGSSVKASQATNSTPPALVITKNTATEAIISLSETDIAKVKEGQKATIEVNAVQNKTFRGIVRRVDSIGTDTQGVIRYSVYIELQNPGNSIRPGMNVDADIVTSEVENVLSVPNASVKPYRGGRAVRVFDTKTRKTVYVPVTIGVRGAEKTQIIKGLTEGQEVITSLSNEELQRPGVFGM